MSDTSKKTLAEILEGKNPEQIEGISRLEGPMLITASAGSGKTTVLIDRISHLLIKDINPTNILVITFTNKAANEIKDRLRDSIGEKADYVHVGTFHSMFREHVLMKYSDHPFFLEQGLDMTSVVILDDKDSDKIYSEAFELLPLKIRQSIDEGLITMSALHQNISLAKAKGYDVEDYIRTFSSEDKDYSQKEATALLWRNYRELCYEHNQIDFDDMLVLSYKLLHHHPSIATELSSIFKFIMIDEYQDSNGVQMLVTDAIAIHHKNICAVGDEKQSIYGWRGSDIQGILNFTTRYTDTHLLSMFRNYRSEKNIINVANAVADAMHERLTDGQLLVPESKQVISPLKYVKFPDVETEASFITKAIKRDMQKGIPGSQIAVVYRNKNIKNELEKNLVSEQVPYQLIGDTSFFQKKEVKDAVSMIRFMFQPWDSQAGLRLLDATNFGVSSKKAKDAMKSEKLPVHQYLIAKSSETRANGTPTKAAEKTKAFLDVMNRIKSVQELGVDHESLGEYISNFWDLYLKSKYQVAAKKSTSNDALANFDSKILNVEEVVKQFVIQYAQSYDIKKTIDEMILRISNVPEIESEKHKKVQLLTLHASKGLEYENVYFMGVDNEAFVGSDPSKLPVSELEEARRLFYVGITRGKNKVVFSRPERRMQFGETLTLNDLVFVNEVFERQEKNNQTLIEELIIEDSIIEDKFKRNHYNYRKPKENYTQNITP
jgi:DNA helicase-2/ATP-dependent DNA helicase PcrA